ncbi:hypothetical protein THRCLA_09220 [Thraustotheca clavata]|uniref:Secreted protein n=1 Tax=Thraustotheca clavata TaxID=74557 RepID=A0A0A7CLI0_9STRA|nr:secreted protein [Thraustotheca clavata]OQR90724.1 hypothetical protein THRCLA_09220 [Thraustotheca clavata]
MKLFVSTLLLATSGHNTAANDQVDAWGQCGGKEYKGSTTCAPGNTCTYLNDWYSQCQPGGDGTVGVWGQCGGSDYKGLTKCATGSICKKWNDQYSQCIPGQDNPVDNDNLPAGWIKLPGIQWSFLIKDYYISKATNLAECAKSADDTNHRFAVWRDNKCQMDSTLYTYEQVPGAIGLFKYDPNLYECKADSDYYGDDTMVFYTRLNRCLDTCDNLAQQGNKCNAVTYVRNPGEQYAQCFIKVRKDTNAPPVANRYGGIACRRK